MQTSRTAIVLAVASLAAALVHPPASAAPPPAETPRETVGTVHAELRTRALKPKLASQLVEHFDAVVGDRVAANGLVLEVTPAADVIVQLEISQPQPDAPLYVVQCIAAIGDDVVVRGEVQSCMGCSATELIDRGLELLPEVTQAVVAARHEAERDAQRLHDAMLERQRPPPEPVVAEPERRRLSAVGYAGITSSAVGISASIVGAILLAQGEKFGPSTGALTVTVVDYRPPGWALIGVGLTATVVGHVMLGLDLGLPHRPRDHTRARMTGVGFWGRATPAGLTIQGQF